MVSARIVNVQGGDFIVALLRRNDLLTTLSNARWLGDKEGVAAAIKALEADGMTAQAAMSWLATQPKKRV